MMILSATATFAQENKTLGKNAKVTEDFEAAPKRWGIIDFSASYLRQSPDYESALETQELMGTPVEILGKNGYWLQVRTPQPYTAWCTD